MLKSSVWLKIIWLLNTLFLVLLIGLAVSKLGDSTIKESILSFFFHPFYLVFHIVFDVIVLVDVIIKYRRNELGASWDFWIMIVLIFKIVAVLSFAFVAMVIVSAFNNLSL